jgi:chorismate dehydratase
MPKRSLYNQSVSYVVGCVPYVNARPLVHALEAGEQGQVRVVYDVPSRLPALLERGEAQAVLASSFEALTTPGRTAAAGICIASYGPVRSVRLFSKKPIENIHSLALDASSMTSNHLAQVILGERYGIRPRLVHHVPDLWPMLESADACVLIGDKGMTAAGDGLYVLDLGEEWRLMTGLPFVWALWIGDSGLSPALVGHLGAALKEAGFSEDGDPRSREEVVAAAAERASWDLETCRNYLTKTICYQLGERELEGLREFQRKLVEHGFQAGHFPRLVAPTAAVVAEAAQVEVKV